MASRYNLNVYDSASEDDVEVDKSHPTSSEAVLFPSGAGDCDSNDTVVDKSHSQLSQADQLPNPFALNRASNTALGFPPLLKT